MRAEARPNGTSWTPPDLLGFGARAALLVHGHLVDRHGKMAIGLLRYGRAEVVAVVDRHHAGGRLEPLTGVRHDAPVVASVREAVALGARVLVVAVSTTGGVLPEGYRDELLVAARAGLSIVHGLHEAIADDAELVRALAPGAQVVELRREPAGLGAAGLGTATGAARGLSARRVLTVGTDMAVGKMTAAIELDRAARRRGLRSTMVASGQIGMAIAGEGVALDAVRVDFATGAVEQAVLRAAHEPSGMPRDVLWVEGQGSLLHPGSTAWLALLRGAQPTDLVLVHRAGQTRLGKPEGFPVPPLDAVIAAYEAIAAPSSAYPAARVRAIALNCGHLDDAAARAAVRAVEDETGIATADVVREGADRLLDALW